MTPTRRKTARRIIMALALGMIALVIVALACGPSAPAGQDDDATPEPTATAVPTDEPSDDNDFPPPTPTLTQLERQYPNMDGNLKRQIEQHEATSEARGASGSSDQPTPTPELILILLLTDTAERVDAAKEFLEDNGAREINCYKGSSEDVIKGECSAYVPVSLLRSLAEQTGVLRIERMYPSRPQSSLQSPSSQRNPVEAHGVTAWRLAGADGSGVKVGIIDYGFKDFRTRLPNLTPAAKPFCYSASGTLDKVNISVCESNIGLPPGDDHGTEVAEALIEIAPDVSLYIANANTKPRVKAAVDWMDANDVDVINYSQADVWDGPGDGTSSFTQSYLNSLDDAVTAGMLWVSAAGNYARNIWFKRGISLTSTRYVDFDPGPNQEWCKNITGNLQRNQQYTFYVRWEGVWNNEDSDFNLHLYHRGSSAWIAHENGIQNGGTMQFPREVMNYTHNAATGGDYCLAISLADRDSVPAWVQLGTFGPPLHYAPGSGSIMNPAESANSGMLAAGAAGYNPIAIKDFSGRGPAPEPAPSTTNPLGRIKPDIVGANQGAVTGTSYAAPRVAGLAAMVVQALTNPLGTPPAPTQVVGYLKQHAQPRSESVPAGTPTPTPGRNNTWGHGFAKLPPPTPPTGLTLRLDSSNPNDILLDYTNSSWDVSSAHRYHLVLERWINNQWQTFAFNSRVSASPARFGGLTQGYWYRAKGQRCVVSTTVSCGPWNAQYSNQLYLPTPAATPTPTPTPTPTATPTPTPTPTPASSSSPPPPTGLALQLHSSDADQLVLDYTRSVWSESSTHRYRFEMYRLVNGAWSHYSSDTGEASPPANFDGLPQGSWYIAFGRRCRDNNRADCGSWSGWSNYRFLPTGSPSRSPGPKRPSGPPPMPNNR